VLRGRWYEEALEPDGPLAHVAATFGDGTTAAVLSRYGRGKTLLVGTNVSAAYQSASTPEADRFFAGLLRWAGVVPPIAASGDEVEVRHLEAGDETVLFVFNHGREAASAGVSVRLPAREYSANDLVSGEPVVLRPAPPGVRIDVTLPPSGVRVVRISPR
jgi:beta-galactosidase